MLLDARNVRKEFDGLVAVDDVSLGIESDEIVGLIGPNGAGKTTLFDVITGVHSPDGDSAIEFEGTDVTALRTHEIVRAGIARTFQLVRTISGMTVLENTLTGVVFGSGRSVSGPSARTEAMGILDFLGLAEEADRRTADLTIAQQKRLELARALASDPELILVDEIASGLTPPEIAEISDLVTRIRDEYGVSVFWVEHIMDAIMTTVDRVIVMENGRVIADGPPGVIREDDHVIEAYLGTNA